MIKKLMMVLLMFSLIFLIIVIFIDSSNNPDLQNPINKAIYKLMTGEKLSPADHIKEDQIRIEDDQVIITIRNAKIARFADTNSMDPLLDEESNAIQIVPNSPDQIYVGDIISYTSKNGDIIIHRVVKIDEDEEGMFYITQGDNNSSPDNEKIRFWQVRFITVGIIY
ncbi:signal peptidase I [Candidatus Woesearchaeota archaeon]|nr:signal peptidase I [Candidatus Woesearchaeota archaeon]